jgi:hypothetical protein
MVDVKVCFGCRQGISAFTLHEDGNYYHLDLFDTGSTGAIAPCINSNKLAPHLHPDGNPISKTYLANPELEAFYREQGRWWQDALQLAYDVLKEDKKVVEFLMNDDEKSVLYTWTNDAIEIALLGYAAIRNLEVKQEDYPDLLLWKK